MRVLFINKFIPPDPAPTAVLIGAVARLVSDSGGEVIYAGSATDYRGPRPTGRRRWLDEALANLRILWRALTCPRPDIIVCLTDPPGCLVPAAIAAALRGAKVVHWAMDVYPEIAVALGELRAESLLHRAVRAGMHWAYSRCAAIACLDDDMVEALGLRGDPRAFISTPWPPAGLTLPKAIPSPNPTTVRWLYSGNLGRAHDYETVLRAQRRLEDAHAPFELVFQGGGPARNAAMQLAAELRLEHCRWQNYAAQETLLESMLDTHVLIATQKLETCGLLWPSKLAPMLALPRAIVWVGPTDGAVAKTLREREAPHGIFAPGEDERLAQWLIDSKDDLLRSRDGSVDSLHDRLTRTRKYALKIWRALLDGVATSSLA